MYNSKITGLGYYVPDNIVTNDDLSKIMDTNDEWIQERTGIKERHWITFVFKNAVVRFSEVIMEGLQKNNLQTSDIDMLIPHQANLRISQFVQKKFGLNDDQIYNNIMKYGNTTAASIIIALTEAWENGNIKDNDLVVLAAFGSGFTWGSVIMRW